MKKTILCLLALLLCLSLVACDTTSNANEPSTEKESTSLEENAYNQLVTYASQGKYLEGWRIAQNQPNILNYKDAQAYYDYCQAMRAYTAGGIGRAYGILKNIPQILDAQETVQEISKRIGHFDGHYVEDNGKGSYLHLVINEGRVATGLVSYYDEDQSFKYTDDDFKYTIVSSKFSNGTEFLAIGNHSIMSNDITINYVMYTEEGSTSIMLVAHETEAYKTFNGLYELIKSPSSETPPSATPPSETPPDIYNPPVAGEPHEHEFNEWTITKEATCTEDGMEERTCSCGEKETRDIEAIGHAFENWATIKQATCTENGMEERTCSCGEKETKTVEATGHSFDSWLYKNDQLESTCSCGEMQTKPLSEASSVYSYLAATEMRSVKRKYSTATPNGAYVYAFVNEDGSLCVLVELRYTLISSYRHQAMHDFSNNIRIDEPSKYYKNLSDRAAGADKIHYLSLASEVLGHQAKMLEAMSNIMQGNDNTYGGIYISSSQLQ